MTLLTIRVVPDPILRKRAREIRVIDDAIRKLARDMIETMQESYGVGLAANQVGVLKRIITLQLPGEEPRIMVNPEITFREGERQIDEGCLSVPGYVGVVTRSIKIKARALDEKGGKLRLTAELLLAQAIEHEVDHLNGILYLDHLVAHDQLRKTESPRRDSDEGRSGADASPSHGHEDAAAPKTHSDPSRPHVHDVTYDLTVDHGDGDTQGRTEHLSASAKLSGLTTDASFSELAYDISSSPKGRQDENDAKVVQSRVTQRKRVNSSNPALQGGVLLDPPARRSTSRPISRT